jgi:hypothetical protein
MYPVVALHPSFRLRRTGGDNANLQPFAHAPKLRRGRPSLQALSLRRRALIDILPVRVQRPGYPILLDPRSAAPSPLPRWFPPPQTRTRGPRGVIHHIHQTSAGSPLLKPPMEAPIHLHQVANKIQNYPASNSDLSPIQRVVLHPVEPAVHQQKLPAIQQLHLHMNSVPVHFPVQHQLIFRWPHKRKFAFPIRIAILC